MKLSIDGLNIFNIDINYTSCSFTTSNTGRAAEAKKLQIANKKIKLPT